jgi:delta 1-pyrroline-5-carboxylate dehydrogenase
MSGPVANNIFRSSGSIVEAAGGLSWQPVVTASTVSVEAAKGYFINTTDNACTITLPSSATAGDQIILIDYARTWGTNAITIDSNGLNFQGSDDTYIVDYDTDGQAFKSSLFRCHDRLDTFL